MTKTCCLCHANPGFLGWDVDTMACESCVAEASSVLDLFYPPRLKTMQGLADQFVRDLWRTYCAS